MNFRSKGLSSVSFDIARSNQKEGSDDRHRANNPSERPLDGFGKNRGSTGSSIAGDPVGSAAKRYGFTGGALPKLIALQAEKPAHVDSLQSTHTFEYKGGEPW